MATDKDQKILDKNRKEFYERMAKFAKKYHYKYDEMTDELALKLLKLKQEYEKNHEIKVHKKYDNIMNNKKRQEINRSNKILQGKPKVF